MTDRRLSQIWSGFERETSRHLTGRGVDNIQTPERRAGRADFAVPEGIAEPAAAAFEALKVRLAAASRAGGRRDRESLAQESPEEAAELSAGAARDLVRGLRSTEARTRRSDRLYGAAGDGAKRRRRKKLFWIF